MSDYEAFVGLTGQFAKLAILAFMIERTIEFIFDWRYIRKFSINHPIKAPAALALSLALCIIFEFDVLGALFSKPADTYHWVGIGFTALFLAGGSAAAMSLFHTVLGLSQAARREQRDVEKQQRDAQLAEAKAKMAEARRKQSNAVSRNHQVQGIIFEDADSLAGGDCGKDVWPLQRQLVELGHMDAKVTPGRMCADTVKGLLSYQNFHGLKQDGMAGPVTKSFMEAPRCGHPDICSDGMASGSNSCGRESDSHSCWSGTRVHYAILNYPPLNGMTEDDCQKIIRDAFDYWERGSVLTFVESHQYPEAEIKLSWGDPNENAGRNLGDTYAFGRFPPKQGEPDPGRIVFDAERIWLAENAAPRADGIRLLPIAEHEIGHAIGLGHSKDLDELMYCDPKYYYGTRPSRLDQNRLRRLYEKTSSQ